MYISFLQKCFFSQFSRELFADAISFNDKSVFRIFFGVTLLNATSVVYFIFAGYHERAKINTIFSKNIRH